MNLSFLICCNYLNKAKIFKVFGILIKFVLLVAYVRVELGGVGFEGHALQCSQSIFTW